MSERKGLVSIILPCYKMGRFLEAALESVAMQSQVGWEIVAVDDCGPDDGSRDIFREVSARKPERNFEWIRHDKNSGVSKARNTAIAASKGEFLAFLDPDDVWGPDHLARAVDCLEADNRIDVVSGPVIAFSGGNPQEGDLWAIDRWKREWFPQSLATHCFLQPSATVVRRSPLERVGGFDTDPAMQHIEDYDLWIRLATAGCRFHIFEDATCYYRKHAAAATADAAKMNQLHDTLIRKHLGFFIQSQGLLLREAISSTLESRIDLTGPLVRQFVGIDRQIRSFKRRND